MKYGDYAIKRISFLNEYYEDRADSTIKYEMSPAKTGDIGWVKISDVSHLGCEHQRCINVGADIAQQNRNLIYRNVDFSSMKQVGKCKCSIMHHQSAISLIYPLVI